MNTTKPNQVINKILSPPKLLVAARGCNEINELLEAKRIIEEKLAKIKANEPKNSIRYDLITEKEY